MFTKKRQRGTALITALLITAICAILSTAMLVNQATLIDETNTVQNADALYLAARATAIWSLGQLKQTAISKNQGHELEATLSSRATPPVQLNGAEASGYLEDASHKFNINALSQTKNQPAFNRFLQYIDPDLGQQRAGAIATALSNWFLRTGNVQPYMQHKPPYRPSHMAMRNITELKQVVLADGTPAFPAALYQRIAPYIVALPTNNLKVNVNGVTEATAIAPVLFALAKSGTSDQAQTLASCLNNHQKDRFDNLSKVIASCPEVANFDSGSLSYSASYYLLNSQATNPNGGQLRLQSLLGLHHDGHGKPYFTTFWQSLS